MPSSCRAVVMRKPRITWLQSQAPQRVCALITSPLAGSLLPAAPAGITISLHHRPHACRPFTWHCQHHPLALPVLARIPLAAATTSPCQSRVAFIIQNTSPARKLVLTSSALTSSCKSGGRSTRGSSWVSAMQANRRALSNLTWLRFASPSPSKLAGALHPYSSRGGDENDDMSATVLSITLMPCRRCQ